MPKARRTPAASKKVKAASKSARAPAPHVKHVKALAKANPEFKQLMATYGMPKPIVPRAHVASAAAAGEICMETDCVDGKKIVMRRGKTGDCTEFSEEPC